MLYNIQTHFAQGHTPADGTSKDEISQLERAPKNAHHQHTVATRWRRHLPAPRRVAGEQELLVVGAIPLMLLLLFVRRPPGVAGDGTERGMIAAGNLGGVDNSFPRGAPARKEDIESEMRQR